MYAIKRKTIYILFKLMNKVEPIKSVPIFYIYDSDQNLVAKVLADGTPVQLPSNGTFYVQDMGDAFVSADI